jgi:hypothetical protein
MDIREDEGVRGDRGEPTHQQRRDIFTTQRQESRVSLYSGNFNKRLDYFLKTPIQMLTKPQGKSIFDLGLYSSKKISLKQCLLFSKVARRSILSYSVNVFILYLLQIL